MEIKEKKTVVTAVETLDSAELRLEYSVDANGSVDMVTAQCHNASGEWLGGFNCSADGSRSGNAVASADFASLASAFALAVEEIKETPLGE